MTKKSYTKPTSVVVEIDNADVLCTSNLNGMIDDVARDEVVWYWDEE